MLNGFTQLVLAIALIVSLLGCGRGDPQHVLAKAQQYREKGDYKAAVIELKNFLQKDGNHAEARYLLGATYHDARDYRLAEQELRRSLDLSYERSKVLPALGRAILMQGEFQRVLDQVPVESHTSNLVQAEVLAIRARALLGLGRPANSRELLEAALAKHPDSPDALVELARLTALAQKSEEASRYLDRAIANSPKHVEAWLLKGDLARVVGDTKGDLAANQKVLEIHPSNLRARLNIASLHIENDALDEAKKILAQARAIAPGDPRAIHLQALTDFRAKDYKSANEKIQILLKGAPNYMPGVLLAGAVLSELGSYEQAQAHVARVLGVAPGNHYARKLLISILSRTGQIPRAIEVLQAGLKMTPDDAELLARAGELYTISSDFSKAAEYFALAAKGAPDDARARTKVGVSRLVAGETERAFADLEASALLSSEMYQADIVLVVSHLRRGAFDQALKAMGSLEKKQPNNPVTYNLKGVVYLGKKDIPTARMNFERALELQPTFIAAATNLAKLDLREKDIKRARGRLDSILERDKNNVPALLALAQMAPALGGTQKERLALLDRARKADVKAIEPQLALASYYSQIGDYKKALEIAQQLQTSNPDNVQLLDLLGAAQVAAGQLEQALTTYRKFSQLVPNSPLVLTRVAAVHERAGNYTAAADTLKRALAIKSDYVDALKALVNVEIRAKRYEEATNIARQVQKQNPKSALGFLFEGDVLTAERKFLPAVKAYEAAFAVEKSAETLIRLHAGYSAAGRANEGDARIDKWLREWPGDNVVRLYAAENAFRRSQYKVAIAQYEILREKLPDNAIVLNNLAWSYAQVKDARALEAADSAYRLAPGNAATMATFGSQLVERGEVARGIDLLEQAANLSPNSPEVRYRLALGWIKKGERTKAREELERALALKQEFPNRAEAKELLAQVSK